MTSRPAPPVVEPLALDGVRYEPDGSPPLDPEHPRAGYIAAIDIGQDASQSLRIWTIEEDPSAPPHPGRYFGRLSVGPAPDEILVEDEFGARFVVDRVRRTVHAVASERPGRGLRDVPPPLPPVSR